MAWGASSSGPHPSKDDPTADDCHGVPVPSSCIGILVMANGHKKFEERNRPTSITLYLLRAPDSLVSTLIFKSEHDRKIKSNQ